ncbi:MAG: serine/threonine-protein kinase, partial [Pseudomonadota bacterium]
MTRIALGSGIVLMGRYTLARRLGHGLGGETWLAQGPSGEVAVKVLGAHEDPEGRRQGDLLREATLLRGLEHPHVVGYRGIHDLAEEGLTLLITDYVPGGDLEGLVQARSAPFGVAEVARLGLQLVDAVAALHARQCLHRDLKPSNVLVGAGEGGLPLLRVADFGISRSLVDGRARSSQPLGSLGYAAPEQYQAGELTPATDRFALGGILLFLATAHHPPPLALGQQAGLARALLRRAQGEGAEGLPELAALVEGLLAMEPDARADLDRCRAVLAALADGRPPEGGAPEAGAPPPGASSRETLALEAPPLALAGQIAGGPAPQAPAANPA